MRFSSLLAAASAAGVVSAAPSMRQFNGSKFNKRCNDTEVPVGPNPFDGKTLFANPAWAKKLEPTYDTFVENDDLENAAKVRTIQNTGTFVWVSDIASLKNIDVAIEEARAVQEETGVEQIVGLVLYDLPDRDVSITFPTRKPHTRNVKRFSFFLTSPAVFRRRERG